MNVRQMFELGLCSSLDLELAAALGRLVSEERSSVLLATALASRAVREGNVCVELSAVAGTTLQNDEGDPVPGALLPDLAPWLVELAQSKLVGEGMTPTPLVLDGTRLYLQRYFEHERTIADRLLRLARPAAQRIDGAAARDALGRLFPDASALDLQAVAAIVAAEQRLAVITGGPGTGKTTTVVRVLALLAELAVASARPLPFAKLVAPTGKAAARLSDAVNAQRATLPVSEVVRSAIPESAFTVHRALSPRFRSSAFRHDATHPLALDVLVVDEASMIDVALMRRLLDAVPEGARVILLGDENQLSSVEAGVVLADICSGARSSSWSTELRSRAQDDFGVTLPGDTEVEGSVSALGDCVVRLTRSHRFDADRGIGRFARAIENGDAEAALSIVDDPQSAEVTLIAKEPRGPTYRRAVLDGYRPLFCAEADPQRLDALAHFTVLSAHRRGPSGAEQQNVQIEQWIREEGWLPSAAGTARFYPGRPIIVTRNDPGLQLFNGDVGLVLQRGERTLVVFRQPGGELRELSPARLPAHETVLALSVHKSQGSEFDEVLLVLADVGSPLSTRELLYTAVTRARQRVSLVGSREAISDAIGRRTTRSSGLADTLWGFRGPSESP